MCDLSKSIPVLLSQLSCSKVPDNIFSGQGIWILSCLFWCSSLHPCLIANILCCQCLDVRPLSLACASHPFISSLRHFFRVIKDHVSLDNHSFRLLALLPKTSLALDSCYIIFILTQWLSKSSFLHSRAEKGRKKCSLLCSWTSLLSQCTLGWEYFIYAGLKFHLKVSIVPERRLSEATSAPLLTLTSIKRVLHFVPIVILIVIVSSSTRRDLCGFVNGSVGKKCFQQFLGHWRQERRWTTLHSHSCSQTMLPAPVSLSLPVLSAPYLGVEVTHTIMISPLGVWSKTP